MMQDNIFFPVKKKADCIEREKQKWDGIFNVEYLNWGDRKTTK